jgi:hypothetical protein
MVTVVYERDNTVSMADEFEGVYETGEFRAGKKRSRAKGFVAPKPEVATIVLGEKTALKFFCCRDKQQLHEHLRWLRNEGRLIHDRPTTLKTRVRVEAANGKILYPRGIVVRGRKDTVPYRRRPDRPPAGVGRWIGSGG